MAIFAAAKGPSISQFAAHQRGVSAHRRGCSRRSRSRTYWLRDFRCSRCRIRSVDGTRCWLFSATPRKSTATSPVIPISRWGVRCSSDSVFRATSFAVQGRESAGILAAVAQFAFHVAARLSLFPSGWIAPGADAHVRQPDGHDAAGRTMAWGGLDVRGVRRPAWAAADSDRSWSQFMDRTGCQGREERWLTCLIRRSSSIPRRSQRD